MIEAPSSFYSDLAEIAIQECTHLNMLISRMENLNFVFPYSPCAIYLAELSDKTKHDIRSRILVTSLYSEGRALDSKERLVKKLKGYNKDHVSAKLLQRIIDDEVGHLKNGVKWFKYFCDQDGLDYKVAHDEITKRLGIIYRPPFNAELRNEAGMPLTWYG